MARPQEPIAVNRKVVWLGGAGIVTALLGAWAIAMAVVRIRVNGPLAAPATARGPAPRFGVLEQQPFVVVGPGDALMRTQRAALQSYRWADPQHTAAQIPVARAEALLLRQRGGRDGGR